MQIKRTSLTTISPRALEVLLDRQNAPFHNAARELRKPLGIYNVTLANIWTSFTEVLDELDHVLEEQSFRQEPPQQWDKTLMRRQEYLILQLMRYFDDCFSVLSSFYPKSPLSSQREDEKQLMKQPPIMAAMNSVAHYREHVANIINHVKHQQGILRGVVAFNDKVAIPGYFVEHMNQTEALEPHPKVHRQYKGQNTAFSLFRDLRYNFWLVYAVGEHTADAIQQLSSPTQNNVAKAGSELEIVGIANRIQALPKWLFWDETLQDFPSVEIEVTDGVTCLILECPSRNIILPALSVPCKVVAGWVGDGTTQTFAPPYFKGRD